MRGSYSRLAGVNKQGNSPGSSRAPQHKQLCVSAHQNLKFSMEILIRFSLTYHAGVLNSSCARGSIPDRAPTWERWAGHTGKDRGVKSPQLPGQVSPRVSQWSRLLHDLLPLSPHFSVRLPPSLLSNFSSSVNVLRQANADPL